MKNDELYERLTGMAEETGLPEWMRGAAEEAVGIISELRTLTDSLSKPDGDEGREEASDAATEPKEKLDELGTKEENIIADLKAMLDEKDEEGENLKARIEDLEEAQDELNAMRDTGASWPEQLDFIRNKLTEILGSPATRFLQGTTDE